MKLACLFLLALPLPALGAGYVFTDLDPLYYPNAVSSNTVVGKYEGGSGRGFKFVNNAYSLISVPNTTSSILHGTDGTSFVGSSDSFPGTANNPSGTHGFVETNGVYKAVDFPNAFFSNAIGISNSTIVGSYRNGAGDHGFTLTGNTYTSFDFPSAIQTSPTGISGNTIVGTYRNADQLSHGFMKIGNVFTTLDNPIADGGPTRLGTIPFAVDGSAIVGTYEDFSAQMHGFLYTNGVFTTLDVPNSLLTYITGISGNKLVGIYYGNDGVQHGFIATAVPEPGTLTALLLATPLLTCRRQSAGRHRR